jgi:hypothetical protein
LILSFVAHLKFTTLLLPFRENGRQLESTLAFAFALGCEQKLLSTGKSASQ